MDKNQIKKEIEKKIDKWYTILFFNAVILLSTSLILLQNSFNIGLVIIAILSIINLFGLIALSIYVYDYVEERYDEFIEREEYFKKQTLKDKILDLLAILWFILPLLLILGVCIVITNFLIGVVYEVSFMLLWLIIPFFFNEDEESRKDP